MFKNDVLKKIRYIFDLGDDDVIKIFASGGLEVNRETISQWLKRDEDADFVKCRDIELASFLNGFINEKRGKKEGDQPRAEKTLSNNLIIRKIMIALKLTSDDVIELLKLADFNLGKSELSAFFRKPTHKHYRLCKDQILRNFLMGLQLKLRPKKA